MTREQLPALFTEVEIRARVADLARAIAAMTDVPDIALPILVGGFVFAADLLRALHSCGVSLPVEFLQLRSYGDKRRAQGEVSVLIGPGENVRGRHVLLIDGVLDHGRTLASARNLAVSAGARAVTSVVAIDKRRAGALLTADFAAFTGIAHFVVGYGMDDAGRLRALPYIASVG
ncbi:MAG TPA: phosphoribosyltransferase family protein [Rhizomicrobium sp.]|nr:phosphoribosyltransferase family protein [Rhizomicrobium sp.]